jgi:hypothetical protein
MMQRRRQAFLETQIGCELSVVTLGEEEDGARAALSTNFIKVLLPGTGIAPNSLVSVKIGRVHGGALYGYVETPAAVGTGVEVLG